MEIFLILSPVLDIEMISVLFPVMESKEPKSEEEIKLVLISVDFLSKLGYFILEEELINHLSFMTSLLLS